MMRPFMSFFGGKWSMAKKLGPPRRDLVIEPFAGSAGYSVYWEPRQVILIERHPKVWGVWNYLQRVSAEEILSIPTDKHHVDEMDICEEAKWLVGFWFNKGCEEPRNQMSAWGLKYTNTGFWSESLRARIAEQIPRIQHWKIIQGSYEDAPEVEAHWHVDPPYVNVGRRYRYQVADYSALAQWCETRRGYTQVCEAEGADWLPFRPFASMKGTEGRYRTGRSKEALWEAEA